VMLGDHQLCTCAMCVADRAYERMARACYESRAFEDELAGFRRLLGAMPRGAPPAAIELRRPRFDHRLARALVATQRRPIDHRRARRRPGHARASRRPWVLRPPGYSSRAA
jgi:hypothetical protein